MTTETSGGYRLGDTNLLFSKLFAENYMKFTEIGPRGGARLDPVFGSQNELAQCPQYCEWFVKMAVILFYYGE